MVNKKIKQKKNGSTPLCNDCFTLINKGIRHTCTGTTRLENLKTFVKKSNPKLKDQIISSLLKEKIATTNKSGEKSTISLSQRAGRPIRISLNPKENTDNVVISNADIMKMQSNLNLSQNKTMEIASMIRVATGSRPIIEPGLKKKLKYAIHCLDPFFEVKDFEFIKIKADVISDAKQAAVYCKDLNGLLEYVKEKRNAGEVHLKFGIDGGKDFLKICLSIQSTADFIEFENNRQTYENGVFAKKFSDSGVKKLFILALAQSTQENYENVLQLWSAININNFDGTIATDLKLANIMTGIMSHSSMHPCTWCVANKNNLSERGPFRTIGNVVQNCNDWCDAGKIKAYANQYMNCINPPIFKKDENTIILDIIPPPELHLMLGVVNTLFNHMLEEFKDEALLWAKSCFVVREVYRGCSGYNGNSCKILLEKLDILRSQCSLGCLKFVDVFNDFRLIVQACFGKNLDKNFSVLICNFKKSYMECGAPITPKVHAVFYHVEDFCTKYQIGLGFYSEQAVESVHSDFDSVWKKYKVDKNHPQYSNRLMQAVGEFNGLRV